MTPAYTVLANPTLKVKGIFLALFKASDRVWFEGLLNKLKRFEYMNIFQVELNNFCITGIKVFYLILTPQTGNTLALTYPKLRSTFKDA